VAADQREPVRRIEIVGEDYPFVGAFAIAVPQQGQAVAAGDGACPLRLDDTGNHVLRRQSRRRSASTFGNQDVAIGQNEVLARDLKIGGNGRDRVALRYRGALIAPLCRVGNLHGGK
jgi:hypothetical protein